MRWILLRQPFWEQLINCILSLPSEGYWLEQPLKGLAYEVNSPKTAVKTTKRSCHMMHPNGCFSFPATSKRLLIQFLNFQLKNLWDTSLYEESFPNAAFLLSFPTAIPIRMPALWVDWEALAIPQGPSVNAVYGLYIGKRGHASAASQGSARKHHHRISGGKQGALGKHGL